MNATSKNANRTTWCLMLSFYLTISEEEYRTHILNKDKARDEKKQG
ncbi:unnamed protein product [Tenebrio molitor]|nr:unnamed protein product [Tenebrio molitor]